MHLTPGRAARTRTLVRILAISVMLGSCAPPQRPPTPQPAPAPEAKTPVPLPVLTTTPLAPDSVDYRAQAQIITRSLQPDSPLSEPARADSQDITESISVQLRAGSLDQFILSLVSDSGYPPGDDRVAPPETLRDEVLPVIVRASISKTGIAIPRDDTLGSECQSTLSLVSPIVGAILAKILDARRSTTTSTDTLRFSSCRTGITRRYEITLRHTGKQADLTQLTISGNMESDSSRALPMRLTGRITGTATAPPDSGGAVLPLSVEIHLTTILESAAILPSGEQRSQRFEQLMSARFRKENP